MKLDEIVAWYQKKIGTYDKQQWEKTVEQKILDGFSSVTLKNAKLKTDLIDVDLVRGSTFPKAKPKQNLLTVIRLAILRYLFLPLYAQWWVKQTSPNIFALLLLMYVAQMITWATYTLNIQRVAPAEYTGEMSLNATRTVNTNDIKSMGGEEQHLVTLSELLIPMVLSLLLSLIHSQIVATNTSSGGKVKRRRFSNTSQGSKLTRDSQKVKRRKKLVKVRTQEAADANSTTMTSALAQAQTRKTHVAKIFTTKLETANKVTVPSEMPADNFEHVVSQTGTTNTPNSTPTNNTAVRLELSDNIETYPTTSAILKKSYQATAAAAMLTLDLKEAAHEAVDCCPHLDNHTDSCSNNSSSNFNHKKRNVNWHSPIHNYAIETQEKQQQTSPQSQYSSSTTSEMNSPSKSKLKDGTGGGGGGTSSTNSSSNNASPNKTVRIDECVQEFYDDMIAEATNSSAAAIVNETASNANNARFVFRRHIGEDDGFESLNGKSSSGEENQPPAASAQASQNQLRLRLNVGACNRQEGELKAATVYRRKIPLSSESDLERSHSLINTSCGDAFQHNAAKKLQTRSSKESSDETDEEGDVGEVISSPNLLSNNSNYNECTTSATEWLGITTNSEECSYSSELDNSDGYKNRQISDEDGYDLDFAPATLLNPHGTTDRISCTIWDQREIKKAQLSVLEISSCIIERVESMPETNDYIYIGICFSFLLSLIPTFCRLCELTIDANKSNEINYFNMPMLVWEKASFSSLALFCFAFGHTQWERTILVMSFLQRLCLTLILFIIFAVAERTFKQRFLYAKLFSHITSSRRARKSNLPHFRLNKVRNIKTWLSVRSYLKKRGPQRSVDIIVSAAFIVTLLLLAFLSVEWLKDSVHLHSHLNLEALMWSTTIGIFLLRFMTLGNKIHQKYRSISVLITEQINLYLQIEQKPKKKDELMVANSVLKLAADLLKELETPFKISGLSANPYLFTTIKVVILSALSGVLSEMLGFKLKLHKIKIK